MFDNIYDVQSDLSVFHRVDDMGAMDIELFLSRAVRLPAYAGATRARLDLQRAAQAPSATPSWTPAAAQADPDNTPPEVVAQLRAGVISAAHGGKSVDEWVSSEKILEEALKYGG